MQWSNEQIKEESLRQSEHKYKTLFNEMLDGFALHEIICDSSGEPVDYRFLDVNPAFERITGLKATEIVGRTVLEVLPETEKHWIDTYGKVALSGESIDFESYSAALGKYFNVGAVCPAINQFACVFEDITEWKQAEEELGRFKTISDNAVYGKMIADLHGNLLYVNRFFANIHGYDPDELIGKHLSVFHNEHQLEAVERTVIAIIQEGHFDPTTVWHCHKDGTEFPMLMNGVLLNDENGNSQYIAASAIDITESKEAMEKTRRSESCYLALKRWTSGIGI